MGFLLLFSLGVTAIISFPLMTALFAQRMGRRFWPWFLAGCILPVISAFIVFFLPDLSEEKNHQD
jgi:hypothetical protein